MKTEWIEQILQDTAYVRTSGSEAEESCADYLAKACSRFGATAYQEAFPVEMSHMQEASLWVDGRQVPCKGYLCAGSKEVEAPLYYLRNTDPCSLKGCRDKIVLLDGGLGYWTYQDILENGALGFITYDGDANYSDRDIDQKKLRPHISKGRKLPGVNINVKDAIEMIRDGAEQVKILLRQEEYEGESHNVVLDLAGELEEMIVLTAHYDTTSLSKGAYDNMSGSIGLLGIAEYFASHPHRYSLRFIWCGSEEQGLLGSKAYCEQHEKELEKVVLNINLDMIGSIMGKFVGCATAEEKLVHYIQYLGSELGFGISAKDGVYPSDSTSFADKGVPAVTFARSAPNNTATIHNSYDTSKVMSAERTAKDIDFVIAFTERMANARLCPVDRKMPDKMKEKLDYYQCRRRKPEEEKD